MHARGRDRSPEERRTRHITAAVMRLHSLQVCASSHAARPGCFSAPPLSHTHSRQEPGEGRRIRDGEMLIIRGEATDSSQYVYMYIYIYILICTYLHFCVLLFVLCYLYAPGSKRVTQFQFSVCMYGTCGRIDNKADFDFDYNSVILIGKLATYHPVFF